MRSRHGATHTLPCKAKATPQPRHRPYASKAITQQSQLAARTWENIQEVKVRQNKAKHLGARRAHIPPYRGAGRHGTSDPEKNDDDDGEGCNPTDLLDFVAALADKANSRLGLPSELAAVASDATAADAAHNSAPNPSPVRRGIPVVGGALSIAPHSAAGSPPSPP